MFLTDTAKYSIGRLRPHFIEVCRPNITCDNSNSFEFQHEYHEKFVCTNKIGDYEHQWKDSRYRKKIYEFIYLKSLCQHVLALKNFLDKTK